MSFTRHALHCFDNRMGAGNLSSSISLYTVLLEIQHNSSTSLILIIFCSITLLYKEAYVESFTSLYRFPTLALTPVLGPEYHFLGKLLLSGFLSRVPKPVPLSLYQNYSLHTSS